MPEPTDHRTEAEEWLESATDRLGDPLASDVMTTLRELALIEALIGIGHALLAEPPQPQQKEPT